MHSASFSRSYFSCRLIAGFGLILLGTLSLGPKAFGFNDTGFEATAAFSALKVKAESPQSQPSQADRPIELVRIFDGDSAIVRYEGETLHVRIVGIDAPEKGQPHANESRDQFVALLRTPAVRIEILKRDVFRRWLVRVEVNGEDLGEKMLRQGNAWFFRRYQSDLSPDMRRRYDRAEREAQAKKLGLWQENDPVAPWDFRARKRKPKDSAGS